MVGRGGELRKLGMAVGVLGVLWLVYFWTAVGLYLRFHFVMPNLKHVQTFTLLSGVACAFSGATVSKKWWAGVAISLLTFTVIMVRVN
jgi:hypothetical protein